MQYICENITQLSEIAQKVINLYQNTPDFPNVWILEGEMGAGKTTFAKALCKAMGIQSHIQSPTYSLVNEYLLPDDTLLKDTLSKNTLPHQTTPKKVYHFDFYRIKNEEEAWDIGTLEYFDSPHICLVEWASQIPSLLPKKILEIQIKIDEVLPNVHIFTLKH